MVITNCNLNQICLKIFKDSTRNIKLNSALLILVNFIFVYQIPPDIIIILLQFY